MPTETVRSTDVARRAGVSQSAVSLVFSGKANGRVSKRTEQLIWKVAHGLDYRPNSTAQALRLGHSRRLVLAVPDIGNPYFAGTLKGAEREARKHGYSTALAVVQMPQDWQTVILDALTSGAVDGFALFTLIPPTTKQQRILRGKAVFVDVFSRSLPCVRLDIEGGMRAAVGHLLLQGHTRIGHLAADIDAETFLLRKKAYLEMMRTIRSANHPEWQDTAPFDIEAASIAAAKIIRAPEAPSAIVCDSDVLAAGVYKAAKAARRRIPEDISVVGIDDSLIASVLDPPLTTVAIPAAEVGEQGVRLLVELLRGANPRQPSPISLNLIVRESTSPFSPHVQEQKSN
jgi:LacI family transcriptional regulator, repressor for deo operon, udp, cdd, tsx, nupC, and nupG